MNTMILDMSNPVVLLNASPAFEDTLCKMWHGHPPMMILSFFSRVQDLMELCSLILALVLSKPMDMQYFHGMLCLENRLSTL